MRSADAGTVTEPFSVSITRVVGSAALVGSSFESLLQPIIATSATISNPAMATKRRQLRIANGGVEVVLLSPTVLFRTEPSPMWILQFVT
ncbi:hypothetical protein TSUKUMMB_46660 [Rhodococcus sp. no. 34]